MAKVARNTESVDTPGYQRITFEEGISGSVFLYMGDDFVAFTQQEWREFAVKVFNFSKQ